MPRSLRSKGVNPITGRPRVRKCEMEDGGLGDDPALAASAAARRPPEVREVPCRLADSTAIGCYRWPRSGWLYRKAIAFSIALTEHRF
jgi:hypothetical protein